MSNRFHSKFHRHNHHTVNNGDTRFPDGGHDPIASPESPFLGDFVLNGSLSCVPSLSTSINNFAGYFSAPGSALVLESPSNALDATGAVNIAGTITHTGNSVQYGERVHIGNTTQTGSIEQVGNNNIFGNLSAFNGFFSGDVTINGNLSAFGTLSYLDTITSFTSAVSVVNAGTGPAAVIVQTGNQPIANFIDDTRSAFFVDGRDATPGFVGINTTEPNVRLTVVGDISSSRDVFIQRNLQVGGQIATPLLSSTDSRLTNVSSTNLFAVNLTSADSRLTNVSSTNLFTSLLTSTTSRLANVTATNIFTNNITLSSNTTTINAVVSTFNTPATATGEFLIFNLNGVNKAIQLWNF